MVKEAILRRSPTPRMPPTSTPSHPHMPVIQARWATFPPHGLLRPLPPLCQCHCHLARLQPQFPHRPRQGHLPSLKSFFHRQASPFSVRTSRTAQPRNRGTETKLFWFFFVLNKIKLSSAIHHSIVTISTTIYLCTHIRDPPFQFDAGADCCLDNVNEGIGVALFPLSEPIREVEGEIQESAAAGRD